ncbi:DUF6146 family protein [Psychroflexus sediminis]|uniref:Lipoprotein n=1 Tax=Psychroflexus sediminis TaxID=470826 RepID=A0A1G7XQF0_9FLAO|nr:DUF6146 family protein [Psychroflexus sediminis]SDG86263.1 hypothetical protein SAMN04488027_10957 [Psychroflexus sediminis]
MKYLLPTLFLAIIIGCSVQKKESVPNNLDPQLENNTIRIANDSLEYEIIILEPGFNAWLVTQRPRGYYGQTYLEQRNRIFVANYNIRANNPSQYGPDLYPMQIDYEYDVDYGYEVNYLLYNYFLYFQEKYRQRLR